MKSFFISLVIVLSLSVTIATAQDTLTVKEGIKNLDTRVVQLESLTEYLLGKMKVLQTRVDSLKKIVQEQSQDASNVQTNKTGKTSNTEVLKNEGNSGSQQCKATTKKGTRCTRMVTDGSGYCWQHK